MEKNQDFINLVDEMRKSQRSYFRTSTYEALNESKRLEVEVDRWIKRFKEERKEKGSQGCLI